MAAIDYTQIVFKNGEWMKNPYTFDEDGNCSSGVPFEYTREGLVFMYEIDGNWTTIEDKIKWYRDEYDAIYIRDGLEKVYGKWTILNLWERLKWALNLKKPYHGCEYESEVGVYEDENAKIYIYREPFKQSYVSFCWIGADKYIVIGGYGHHENVYVHFMHRGYGDKFEEKMAREALWWAVHDPLNSIADAMFDNMDERDSWYWMYQKIFLDEPDYYEYETEEDGETPVENSDREATDVLYICDGGQCETCHPEDCRYTTDVSHAKNFKLEHGAYIEDDKAQLDNVDEYDEDWDFGDFVDTEDYK